MRARRAGFEAWIGAGEGWTDGSWTSEGGLAPQLLFHEGLIDADTWRRACGRPAEVPSPLSVMRREAEAWPLELAVYPCAR